MSELKPCHRCQQMPKLTQGGSIEKGVYVLHDFAECANEDCPEFGVYRLVQEWQTRPLEDALLSRAEKAEAKNTKLHMALMNLFNACMDADINGELADNIHGGILDQARGALK